MRPCISLTRPCQIVQRFFFFFLWGEWGSRLSSLCLKIFRAYIYLARITSRTEYVGNFGNNKPDRVLRKRIKINLGVSRLLSTLRRTDIVRVEWSFDFVGAENVFVRYLQRVYVVCMKPCLNNWNRCTAGYLKTSNTRKAFERITLSVYGFMLQKFFFFLL